MIIFRCSIGLGALVTIRTKANKFSSSLHFLTLLVLLLLLLQTREVCELFFFAFATSRLDTMWFCIFICEHTQCSVARVHCYQSLVSLHHFWLENFPKSRAWKKRAKTNNEITKSCNVKFLIVCFRSMHQTSTSFFFSPSCCLKQSNTPEIVFCIEKIVWLGNKWESEGFVSCVPNIQWKVS